MSIHKSLVPASALRRHRNVLKRSERIEELQKEGRFTEGRSIFGLPKVRNILMRAKKVKKEETAAGTEATAVPGAAPAAASAAGAKPGAAAPAKGAAAPAAKPAAAPAKKEEKKK